MMMLPGNGPSMSSIRLGRCIVLATLLSLGACSGSSGDESTDRPDEASPTGTLKVQSFTGSSACTALETYIEDTASAMMRAALLGRGPDEPVSQPGVQPVPQTGEPQPGAPGTTPGADAAPGSGSVPGRNDTGRPAFSDTNVREIGIDEPDPVKNDGTRMLALRDDGATLTLSNLQLTPPQDMRVTGQHRWPGNTPGSGMRESINGLFLIDTAQTAVVTSLGGSHAVMPMPASASSTSPAIATSPICTSEGCFPGGQNPVEPRTRLRVFSTPADAAPAESWMLEVAGALVQARRIGKRIYIVSQAGLALPDGVRFFPDAPAGTSAGSSQWQDLIDATIARNELLIRQRSLAQWLAVLDVQQRGVGQAPASLFGPEPDAARCASFARIDTDTRLAWLQLSTIDIDSRRIEQQTLLAGGEGVYMSPRSLVVFTPWWRRTSRQGDNTQAAGHHTLLHRFAIDGSGAASYQASGSFAGRLINDYAIHESSNGNLHVVAQAFGLEPYSYLASLAQTDAGRLDVVGKTDPIAPGETLQSARFIGDRAYFVTFRVVDPFFVYDLSEATNPRKLGELKIPGFSSYLHQVGSNHLLGIGYDSGERTRRIKASLFDVTNPADPREQSVLTLGDVYTGSDALWDPHAFTFFTPDSARNESLAAIPVRSYAFSAPNAPGQARSQSGVRLIRIDPALGERALELIGTLDMTDLLNDGLTNGGWRAADARRAIFIGSTLYGVSDTAVRAAPLLDPATPTATLAVP